MIDKNTFTIEWIKEVSAKNRNADKLLVEKVCRAFILLEVLSESGLDFIFKGGTALMLLTDSRKRLSIDIDIIVPNHIELNELLEKTASQKGFVNIEKHNRKKRDVIDKTHYKFFYVPAYRTALETDYILLDILFEEPKYKNIRRSKIESPFLKTTGEPVEVHVPGFEDILGDKLTAYAPNTTGIPYKKGNNSTTMEICKQLYDIGTLFDQIDNIVIVRSTFMEFAETEAKYRDIEITPNDVLEDIYQTSLCITTRGQDGNGDFEAILAGIKRVRTYIFSESYHLERAIRDAAKAAYLSTLIKSGRDNFERYKNAEQIKEMIIDQPFNTKLNKLRKTDPESFFYWYHTCSLLK
ncbi:MAG: nucleotidyl transferase AbiEii/AbiGii toxin family protein [Bacteroidetes bacterium]|nr:nucleotidyl transferase AbiEii/AbiGii toxin family protein [Bacteroidota bacterium]